MNYHIQAIQVENYLFKVCTNITEDSEAILTGQTFVVCETEQEAQNYAEMVFLPDLRRNFPREIGELVLPGDISPEEPEEVIEE